MTRLDNLFSPDQCQQRGRDYTKTICDTLGVFLFFYPTESPPPIRGFTVCFLNLILKVTTKWERFKRAFFTLGKRLAESKETKHKLDHHDKRYTHFTQGQVKQVL